MILLFLCLLLPSAIMAQITFDPLRLDDSLGTSHYSPRMLEQGDANLLCIWSQATGRQFLGVGQRISLDGHRNGDRIIYEQTTGQYVCPPQVTVVPLSTGGEARLIYHS
jgi:hypothetical protein